MRPCASMVASLGLPLRLTVIPRSRLHFAGRKHEDNPKIGQQRTILRQWSDSANQISGVVVEVVPRRLDRCGN